MLPLLRCGRSDARQLNYTLDGSKSAGASGDYRESDPRTPFDAPRRCDHLRIPEGLNTKSKVRTNPLIRPDGHQKRSRKDAGADDARRVDSHVYRGGFRLLRVRFRPRLSAAGCSVSSNSTGNVMLSRARRFLASLLSEAGGVPETSGLLFLTPGVCLPDLSAIRLSRAPSIKAKCPARLQLCRGPCRPGRS